MRVHTGMREFPMKKERTRSAQCGKRELGREEVITTPNICLVGYAWMYAPVRLMTVGEWPPTPSGDCCTQHRGVSRIIKFRHC